MARFRQFFRYFQTHALPFVIALESNAVVSELLQVVALNNCHFDELCVGRVRIFVAIEFECGILAASHVYDRGVIFVAGIIF